MFSLIPSLCLLLHTLNIQLYTYHFDSIISIQNVVFTCLLWIWLELPLARLSPLGWWLLSTGVVVVALGILPVSLPKMDRDMKLLGCLLPLSPVEGDRKPCSLAPALENIFVGIGV